MCATVRMNQIIGIAHLNCAAPQFGIEHEEHHMVNSQILIVRHAESAKNLRENFDGNPDLDHLTDKGIVLTKRLSKSLRLLPDDMRVTLFCADSGRAQETARLLAASRPWAIETRGALGSMSSGPFAGLNDQQLSGKYSEFFDRLKLFRAGLLSGYSLAAPEGAEAWVDFELKTNAVLDEVERHSSDLRIIVCHRSSMIALLVNLSRRFLDYPVSHFGFVHAPPLFAALVNYAQNKAAVHIGEGAELIERINSSR